MVTAAQKEYDSFLDAPYGYTAKNLLKCGFPRFDLLETQSTSSKIIIMPSWRQSLTGEINHRTNLAEYNPNFKQSDFFQFYYKLINDKKLLGAMKKKGVSGEFYLHPALAAQIDDFSSSVLRLCICPMIIKRLSVKVLYC
jgi:hypothetical protein